MIVLVILTVTLSGTTTANVSMTGPTGSPHRPGTANWRPLTFPYHSHRSLEGSHVLGAVGVDDHAEFFLDLADEGVDAAFAGFSLPAGNVVDLCAA